MCVMASIREIAEKHLDAKLKDLGVNIPNYRHIAINIMLNFGKEVCEEQKVQCASSGYQCGNQTGVEIEQYILNSKNVCDE